MFNFLDTLFGEVSVLCTPRVAPQWITRHVGQSNEYHGMFVLVGAGGNILARLRGRIIEWPGLPVDVYIYDPPEAVRRHRHGRCLQLVVPNSRWFKLHWEKPARSFDQARAYVEQLMGEAMTREFLSH